MRRSIAILLVPLACVPTDPPIVGNDDTMAEPPGPDTGDPTLVGTTTSETGEPTTTGTEGGTSTTDESTSPPMPPPVCGNGFPEGDEPCDDGNDEPDDGCNAVCERTGVPIWTQSWDSGAKQDDIATAIAVDADGNYYVSGTVEGADSFSDGVARKLAPDGTELQQFVYAGAMGFDDGAAAIAVGDDGRVYLGGYEELTEEGQFRAYLAKFSTGGEIEWTYTRESPYLDGSSNILAVAVRGDTIYSVGSEEVTDEAHEIHIHRHEPSDGSIVWTVTVPDAAGFNRHGAVIDPNGDLIVATGLRLGPDDTPVPVVARYSIVDGAEIWQKTYGGGALGVARGLAINAAGELAINGYLQTQAGHFDIWTARLDPDGATVWEASYDRNLADDYGYAVGWSSSGQIYSAGLVFDGAQQSNAWVRRYEADGAPYWTSVYNDLVDLYDEVQGVAVTDSQVVVAGNENVLQMGINQWIRAYEP